MKKIAFLSLIVCSLLITGCNLNPSPNQIDIDEYKSQLNENNYGLKAKIKAGDSLKDVIRRMQLSLDNVILIDKTLSNIVFLENIEELKAEELRQYIKLKHGKTVVIRKYNNRLFAIEEILSKEKKKELSQNNIVIPELDFKLNGIFTYGEIFNILREFGLNIYIDLEDNKKFNYKTEAEQYSGDLNAFLKYVAAKEKLFIILEKDGVKLKDVQTKSYVLNIPNSDGIDSEASAININSASTTNIVNSVINNNNNNNSIQGLMNNQPQQQPQQEATEVKALINPLVDLNKQLKDMLKDDITYSLNENSGMLSVTGNYNSLEVVDQIIGDFKDVYKDSIKIELNVYEVAFRDDQAFGVDYSMIRSELIGDTVSSTFNMSTNLMGEIDGLTGTNTGVRLTNNGAIIGGNSLGSKDSFVFNYLNKFGRTTVVTKPTVNTLNNIPVKLDVVDTLEYVSSLNQQSGFVAGGVGTSSSMSSSQPQINSVTTGYSLVVHPKIDGEYININLKNVSSTLNGLIPYSYETSNGNEGDTIDNVIYLKDTSSRQFNEKVKIKEGEIAIIGGYMYERKISNKTGLPFVESEDSMFDPLTSAKNRNVEKVEIVITISVKVI